jgi:hypothetical protein
MSRFRFLGEDPFIGSLQIVGISVTRMACMRHVHLDECELPLVVTELENVFLSKEYGKTTQTGYVSHSDFSRDQLRQAEDWSSPRSLYTDAAIPQETESRQISPCLYLTSTVSTQRSPWLYLNNHPCPIGHAAAAVCTPTFAYMDSTLHRSTTAPCAPQCFSPNALSFDESGNQ